MGIFNQLGGLFLSAVPTVIIVLLFYFFMRWCFFTPITGVLEERHRRAEGARQEAEAIRGSVKEKLRVYNEALRKARGEMFVEQEKIRHRALDERQAAVNAARLAAQQELLEAKKALEAEVEATREQLQESSAVLANQIAEAIIAGASSVPDSGTRGEAR